MQQLLELQVDVGEASAIGIPASILIFNKGKKKNTDVLFIDASKHFESAKNQNKLCHNDKGSDIDKIASIYQAFQKASSLN